MEDSALQRGWMQGDEERCVLFGWTSAWVGMGSKTRKQAIYKPLRMEAGCDASTDTRGRKIPLSSARA
ncbi:hypothetical protein WJ86_08645 [Burkholderia multivorans]|nr:hypothetical protein WJ86_08645 [Burkholderia multivorans]